MLNLVRVGLCAVVLCLMMVGITISNAWAQSSDTLPEPQSLVRIISFPGLDTKPAVRIIPTEEPPKIEFGRRLDESVDKAVLKVRYQYSPMLTPLQSHVRVLLNGEVMGVLPIAL